MATCGAELRARERGKVEYRGANLMSTDFLGVVDVLGRTEDFNADFFTEPFKCSKDFRGSEVDDDDKLRSFGIH